MIESLVIMILGMISVFVFLTLIIFSINISYKIISTYDPASFDNNIKQQTDLEIAIAIAIAKERDEK